MLFRHQWETEKIMKISRLFQVLQVENELRSRTGRAICRGNRLADVGIHVRLGFEGGKALRVIPRGKQKLTVYRAHQVGSM